MGRPAKKKAPESAAVATPPVEEDLGWKLQRSYPSYRSEWTKDITTELVKIFVANGRKPNVETVNEAAEAAERIVQRTYFIED